MLRKLKKKYAKWCLTVNLSKADYIKVGGNDVEGLEIKWLHDSQISVCLID